MDFLDCNTILLKETANDLKLFGQFFREYTQLMDKSIQELSILYWSDSSVNALLERFKSKVIQAIDLEEECKTTSTEMLRFATELEKIDKEYAQRFETGKKGSYYQPNPVFDKYKQNKSIEENKNKKWLDPKVLGPLNELDWSDFFSKINSIKLRTGKFEKDAFDFFNGLSDINDMAEVFGFSSEQLSTLGGDKAFGMIGNVFDLQEFVVAVRNDDYETVSELCEKYIIKAGSKGLKSIGGLKGFEAEMYARLGWNYIENLSDLDEYFKDGFLTGLVRSSWYLSGGCVVETGVEKAFDIVEDVGGLFGYDVNAVYEDLTGTGGVEGFNKAMNQLTGYIKDDLVERYHLDDMKNNINQQIEYAKNDMGKDMNQLMNYIKDDIVSNYYSENNIFEGTGLMLRDSVAAWGDMIKKLV